MEAQEHPDGTYHPKQEIIDYDEWYSSGSQGSGCYTSSSAGLDAYATSSEDDLDSSMSSMSGEAMEQGPLIGMTADGFEKAMKVKCHKR